MRRTSRKAWRLNREMGRRREMVYGEDGRADDSGKRDSSVVGSVYSV